MKFEELIQKIGEESGLDEGEVKDRVEGKREELNGLITLEGAAHIIAGELGINLLDTLVEIPRLKLENVIPGMSSVDIVGKLTRLFEVRVFERDDKTKGKVASGIISDDTSSIRIVFWDERAELVESGELNEGDIIRLRDGYTKENLNGEAEIHVGGRSSLFINPEDVDKSEFPALKSALKKLSELSDGMQDVSALVKVLRIYEPRGFSRDDGTKGKVVNLYVADETGSARLVLWDDDVGLVEKGEIKENDILKVKRAYVRERLEELEVHVGRYGKVILNPENVELDSVANVAPSRAGRASVDSLQAGMKAELLGALVRIYDNPTIYEKDGEKRFVVNGVFDDGTGRLRLVFFNKMGELLLNTTLKALLEGDPQAIVEDRAAEILGKEILVAGNVRQNEQTGRLEVIVFDLDLNPDPKKEIERLLKEAETIVNGEPES